MFLAYLSSEVQNTTESLIASDQEASKEGRLKGRAEAYYAVLNLCDYLDSITLKADEIETEAAKIDTSSTRVD